MVVYLLEVGVALIVAPWTRFWDRNYFIEALPLLESTLTSPAVRGAVSGFGLVAIGAAAVDVSAWLRRRWTGARGSSRHSLLSRPVQLASQDLREEVYPPSS